MTVRPGPALQSTTAEENNSVFDCGRLQPTPNRSTDTSRSRWRRLPHLSSSALIVFLASVVVASTYLDLRSTLACERPLIGHADQAHTALVARNIAEGRGAVSYALWLLRDLPADQTRVYGENYWSIYVAYYISFFFQVMGRINWRWSLQHRSASPRSR